MKRKHEYVVTYQCPVCGVVVEQGVLDDYMHCCPVCGDKSTFSKEWVKIIIPAKMVAAIAKQSKPSLWLRLIRVFKKNTCVKDKCCTTDEYDRVSKHRFCRLVQDVKARVLIKPEQSWQELWEELKDIHGRKQDED